MHGQPLFAQVEFKPAQIPAHHLTLFPNQMNTVTTSSGMRNFLIIWLGQLVSLVGSQLTGFALGVWVYDQTRSVLMLALTQVAMQAPYVLLSPLAGVLADRWSRRSVMIVSDVGAGLAVLTAALLYLAHALEPWMVIPINIVMASFTTLMWPAYSASVSLLVPKEQYGRANGLVQLGEAIPQVAGPALAGALYAALQVGHLALIDFATYVFAAALMLFLVRIPSPAPTESGHEARGSVWKEMRFGWDYIHARHGLLSLLMYFLSINLLIGLIAPLFTPLVLDNWDARTLGVLSTIMGVGMLAGTLTISAWGGGKRKMFTLLGAGMIASMFVIGYGLRASIPLLAICGFGLMFVEPMLNASSQAIWQAKVAPDVQGRVFGVRRTIAMAAQIGAPLLAAPLADHVFKPALFPGQPLAGILAPIFGPGVNRGIGLQISVIGILTGIVTLIALGNRNIRNLELDLPDHGASPEPDAGGTVAEPAG